MSADKGKPQAPKPPKQERPSEGQQPLAGQYPLPSIPRQSPYPADPRLIDTIEKGWRPGIFHRKPSGKRSQEG